MAADRPNFILLVAEDTGLHQGCYGDRAARTPHIDRLASEGMRWTAATSTCPVCAPSRSSLVTGVYPWSQGTHHMRSTLIRPPRLFTQELRDAGYFVSWPTKTDFNFNPLPGWVDDTGDWTDDLRAGRLSDKPFFLYQNFDSTHESTLWAKCPGKDSRKYTDAERRRLFEATGYAPIDPESVTVPPYLPEVPEVRGDIVRYYEALAIQDHQIGNALSALAQSPYADNTVVIYLSDHGRGLAREKRWCYGAGLYMPLIVRQPGRIPSGAVNDALVSWVDIAPTILSLARVGIPAHYQGHAFLGDAAGPPRVYAFAGRDRMDEAFDRVRAVRDGRWHYLRNFFPQIPYAQRVRYMEIQETTQALRREHARGTLTASAALWMAERKPAEELYDWHADPFMVNNLAGRTEHAGTVARLREALDRCTAKFGDLGRIPEKALVDQGLVTDRLGEYRPWLAPLPPEHRIGTGLGIIEMPAE